MTKLQGGVVDRIPYPLRSRILQVTRVERIAPSMRRIVLGGEDLEAEFPFVPLAAADHVKVALPDPVTGVVSPAAPSALRDYTIRAVDHTVGELTLDFVVHQHGPAGRWADSAQPGSCLGILGPRGSQVYPDWCPSYLLVADETGRPATERFLAGVSGSDAAEALVATVAGLPVGRETYVWAAGEAAVMRALRNHLRLERRVDPHHLVVRGYWRQGLPGPPSEQKER